jgi:hypothetical protein
MNLSRPYRSFVACRAFSRGVVLALVCAAAPACEDPNTGAPSASASTSTAAAKPSQTAAGQPSPRTPSPTSVASSPSSPATAGKVKLDWDHKLKYDAAISEARTRLAAIMKGAKLALEASTTHAACPAAAPLPAEMPKGLKKVQPDVKGSGDDPGWKCIKFMEIDPLYMQYTFASGSGYKSAGRGIGDPPAKGFEACAEADFVEGGATTLICSRASIDDKGTATIDPKLHIDDEFEGTPDVPAAPAGATNTSVCKVFVALFKDNPKPMSQADCEADLAKKAKANPDAFACIAGCSTLKGDGATPCMLACEPKEHAK